MMTREIAEATYPFKPLREVATFLDHKRRPVTKSERKVGTFPYYGANGLQGTIDSFIFDEPLVLLAEDGGHFDDPERGIAYEIAGKTWVNNHAHVLKPRNGDLNLTYLRRVLENYDVRPFINGSTRSKLTKAQAERIPIPLPPLDEQRRIVAILDKADALRRKRTQALDLLDSITQSIFLEVSKSFSATCATISTFARVQGGKRLPKGHDYCDEETGYKYLRVIDLQKEGLRRGDLKNLSVESFKAISRYVVGEGDVVISIAGTIGATRYIDADLAGVNLTENAAKIVLNDQKIVDPVYLVHALQSELLQKQIRASTGQVTIGKLALFRIEKLEVPLPPIDEQRRFALQASEKQRVRRALAKSADMSNHLFSSLQSRAFSGQL